LAYRKTVYSTEYIALSEEKIKKVQVANRDKTCVCQNIRNKRRRKINLNS